MNFGFNLVTKASGFNCGRTYSFRVADNDKDLSLWINNLKKLMKLAMRPSVVKRLQTKVKALVNSSPFQQFFAVLIAANYVSNVIQAEMTVDPGSAADSTFNNLDLFFTLIFAVELGLGMFAHWFWAFFSDGWSLFDLVVVGVSLLALAVEGLPGVSFLRLMRVFRVLRIFARLRSLRIIVVSLTASVAPVCNALLVLALVATVYAIMGVLFFAPAAPAHFATFSRSLFTMFTLMTFDHWTETLAEAQPEDDPFAPGAVLFLRKAAEEDERRRRRQAGAADSADSESPLWPLLEKLMDCENTRQIEREIQAVFKLLDEEGAGEISAAQMCAGFRRLGQALGSRMHWDGDGAAAAVASTVDAGRFAGIMRLALQQHVEKAIGRAMGACSPAGYERTLLAATRALMLSCGVQHSVDDFPGPAASAAPELPRDSGLRTSLTAVGGGDMDFQVGSPLALLIAEATISSAMPIHGAVSAAAGAMALVDLERPPAGVMARRGSDSELPQGHSEGHLSPLASRTDADNTDGISDAAVDAGGFEMAIPPVRQESWSETICRLREEVAAAAARLAAVSHELHVAADWELPAGLPAPSTSDCAETFAFFDSDAPQSTAQGQHAEDAFFNDVSRVDRALAASGWQGILLAQKSTGESSSQSSAMEYERCKENAASRNCVDHFETASVCCSDSMPPSIPRDANVNDTGGRLSCDNAAVLLSARAPSLKLHTAEASSNRLEPQVVSTFRDGGEGNHTNVGNCKAASKEASCDSATKIYAESVPEFSAANLRWSLVLGMDWKSVWPGLWEGAEHTGRTLG
eukprot:CAMPEP_0172199686 /NCGR_PEP_ID=MMETSP1050-20130122/28837_1 /TAXON_ID=233186 /ORGANISM="Cryptomonas curvata, Strain CCAP979/52" /LENGTH=805 /DNA_ID=CAMNT_0012876759 /DNA_START=463 /DNA_END=2881 /DNA_ORIENTATION=-